MLIYLKVASTDSYMPNQNWNLLLSFEVTKDKFCFELSLSGATLKADVTAKEYVNGCKSKWISYVD